MNTYRLSQVPVDVEASAGPGPQQSGSGIALMLISSAANQSGAALGATAFAAIGPVGVVAVRQFVTALVLLPVVRPRLRGFIRAQWLPVLALSAVLSGMNLTLYLAIDRIGLGLAVTLEFLGPLAVAVAGSRRPRDLAAAVLAAAGVVVLTSPGPSSDLLGIGSALVAATGWAGYILLNRTLGRRLPGLQGTAAASAVTAAIWLPVAGIWFAHHPPTPVALLPALACGLLSSIVPYAADLAALRRVRAAVFATVTSINPVWAVVAGWLFLGQRLDLHEWVGISAIIVGNVVVTARGAGSSRDVRDRWPSGRDAPG